MRILFALPYVPSPIRVRPYNFVQVLSRAHEVSVLATATGGETEAAEHLRSLCRSVDVVRVSPSRSLRSCALAALRGEPLQAAYCRSPQVEHRLTALLQRESFDVVHVEHLRAAYLRDSIPRELPTVFDSVDCISLLLERTLCCSHSLRQRAIAALELARTRTYEATMASRYDCTAISSPADGQALQSLAPSANVAVVPNGVDLEYFRPHDGEREPVTLVFSGKMSYHANATAVFHFVRHIFPLIRRVRPETRLRIVGSKPPAAVLALARDSAITVTGYLPDLRAAVGRATVAICPVTVKVGIQNKVLEAMAMGLPVVCTREGVEGLGLVAGRDALVADNPTAFADAVCRLLGDASLRDQLGGAGRRYVEANHRWEVAGRRLEALYADAIARRTLTQPSGLHFAGRFGATATD
ncbi:MAG: glycosyltransferase [Chloroflexota bacterium]